MSGAFAAAHQLSETETHPESSGTRRKVQQLCADV